MWLGGHHVLGKLSECDIRLSSTEQCFNATYSLISYSNVWTWHTPQLHRKMFECDMPLSSTKCSFDAAAYLLKNSLIFPRGTNLCKNVVIIVGENQRQRWSKQASFWVIKSTYCEVVAREDVSWSKYQLPEMWFLSLLFVSLTIIVSCQIVWMRVEEGRLFHRDG